MLFLFVFTGAFGGYASGRLFRMLKGTRWKANGAAKGYPACRSVHLARDIPPVARRTLEAPHPCSKGHCKANGAASGSPASSSVRRLQSAERAAAAAMTVVVAAARAGVGAGAGAEWGRGLVWRWPGAAPGAHVEALGETDGLVEDR
jgi:hypothetical protein